MFYSDYQETVRKARQTYSNSSDERLKRAAVNFSNSLFQITSPYSNFTSCRKAFAFPFYHATQLLRNIVDLVSGPLVVGLSALGSLKEATKVSFAMLRLTCATILEVLNIVLSITSLATRLIASLFNLGYGYISAHISQLGYIGTPRKMEGMLESTPISKLNGSDLCQRYDFNQAQANDEYEQNAAFMLI